MKIDLFLKMAHELDVSHFPQGVTIERTENGSYFVAIRSRRASDYVFVTGAKSYDAAWDAACDKMIATAKTKAEHAEREALNAKNRAARVMDLVPA